VNGAQAKEAKKAQDNLQQEIVRQEESIENVQETKKQIEIETELGRLI